MQEKLLYWIDVFCPAAYTGSGSNRHLYLVVVPAVSEKVADCAEVKAYLQRFSTAATAYTLVPLKDHLQDIITDATLGARENEEVSILPVPLHPEMKLALNGVQINQFNGVTGYTFADSLDKLRFVVNNFNFLPLRLSGEVSYPNDDYRFLDHTQKVGYGNWLTSVLTEIKKIAPNGSGDTEKAIIAEKWHELDFVTQISNETGRDASSATPPLSAASLCAKYALLINKLKYDHGIAVPDKFDPPAYRFTLEALDVLKNDAVALMARIGTEQNYNKLLAQGLVRMYDPNDPGLTKIKEQLQLFYGSGERLRVLKTSMTSEYHFMRVHDDDIPSGEEQSIWRNTAGETLALTNNYSLAGHVVALSFNDITDIDVYLQTLSIALNGQELLDSDTRTSIKALYLNATQNAPTQFRRHLIVNPPDCLQEAVKGKASYYQVNAFGLPDAALDTAFQAFQLDPWLHYQVPELLMDELEEKPRVDYSNTASAFITFPEQRKFLRRDELLPDGVKFDNGIEYVYPHIFNHFLPAVTVKVFAKKVKLPDGEFIYKISKKHSEFCGENDKIRFNNLLRQTLYSSVAGDSYGFYLGCNNAVNKYEVVSPVQIKQIAHDDDELVEIYVEQSAALNTLVGTPDSKTGLKEMDLILLPGTADTAVFWDCFNLLLRKKSNTQADKPFLVLKGRFRYKFNLCINNLSANLQANLSLGAYVHSGITGKDEHGNVVPCEPIADDYSNFNKCRLLLLKDGKVISINRADALIPVQEEVVRVPPQNFSGKYCYVITHSFADKSSSVSTNQDGADPESDRYLLYSSSSRGASLKAKLEHQYGYRLHTPDTYIRLPYNDPLRNIATLFIMKEQAGNKEEQPALLFYVRKPASGPHTLFVSLKRAYLLELLKANSVTLYREFYEAIFDIMHNQVQLYIEGWDFTNRNQELQALESAHPEKSNQFPSVIDHLHKRSEAGASVQLQLQQFASNSYALFLDAVKAAASGLGDIVLAERPLTAAEAECDLLRAGLLIHRRKEETVWADFPGWDTQDTVPPGAASEIFPLPLPPKDNLTANNAFLSPDFAVAGLTAFLQDKDINSLYHSFNWITSQQYLDGFKQDAGQDNNVLEILGETARHICLSPLVKSNTNVLTYYTPYAFLPLNQRAAANSTLSSPAECYDFVRYLMRLLSLLAYPESNEEGIKEFLRIKWQVPGSNAAVLSAKFRAREILEGDDVASNSIAGKIAGLLAPVDNEFDARGTDHQQVIATRSMMSKQITAAFTSMFIADPMLFLTAKAMGVGLLTDQPVVANKPAKSDDLYAFRLIKSIPEKKANGTDDIKTDVSLFNFNNLFFHSNNQVGFYIEALEDELYVNEFQIPEDAQGIQARTAEHVLKNLEHYTLRAAPPRDAAIMVKHFCESWRTGSAANMAKFYLLPSRLPPSIPLCAPVKDAEQMVRKHYFSDGQKDWRYLQHQLDSAYIWQVDSEEAQVFESVLPKVVLHPGWPASGVLPADWLRLDSYTNQYYFIVEPDEEGKITNDTFDIFVEGAAKPAPNVQVTSTAAGDPIWDTKLFEALLNQYDYYVRRGRKGDLPDELAINDLLDMTPTSSAPDKLHGLLLHLLKPSDIPSADISNCWQLRSTGALDDWNLLRPKNAVVGLPTIGDVLAVNILRYTGAAAAEGAKPRFMIKVAVLADPWAHYRCRLRVRRNKRDFNNDGIFDINPAFEMRSDVSSWQDHGIQHLRYNYIMEDATVWPDDLKYLKVRRDVDPTIGQFLSGAKRSFNGLISDQLQQPRQFGQMLFKHAFRAIVSHRPGFGFMPVFNTGKTLDEVIAWERTYADKVDHFLVDGTKEGVGLDDVLMPLPIEIPGWAPFIQVMWFSSEQPQVPVFSINWQLRFPEII